MCLFLRKGTFYTMKRKRTLLILALSMFSFFVIIVFHQSLISLMREMDHYKNGEEYEINTVSSMNLAVSQKPKGKSIFSKIEKSKQFYCFSDTDNHKMDSKLDPFHDHWRETKVGQCDVYIYSAFLDDRRKDVDASVKVSVAVPSNYLGKCATQAR